MSASRQERQAREKIREETLHKRQIRRNQIIFGILSVFLILSMVLQLVHW